MSDHHDDVSVHSTSGQKTLKAYVVGFVLCIMLTVIAFGLVQAHTLSDTNLYISLAGLAIVQLIVQSVCFLNLNSSDEGRWNLLPFLFALIIIAILVGGSLWIMYNLNINMMS